MDERPQRDSGSRSHRRRSPLQSAVRALERAAVGHYRRGGPRVEGRRLTVVADAQDAAELREAVAAGADAVRLLLAAAPGEAGETADAEALAALVGHGRAHDCRVWGRLRGPVPQPRLPAAAEVMWAARQAGMEAFQVDDLGLLSVARALLPDLAIHAGPELGARSTEAAALLEDLGATRVVLPPEVTLAEARSISSRVTIELEAPVHGPPCFALAGRCGLSGRTPNDAPCAGPCAAVVQTDRGAGPGLGQTPRFGYRHVPALHAAGLAAVGVSAGGSNPLGAAVAAVRAAVDAGPLLDDESEARAEALLQGRMAPPAAGDTLEPGPRGLRLEVEVARVDAGLHVIVRDKRHDLVVDTWPTEPGAASVELETALAPPPEALVRVDVWVLRGVVSACIPDREERVRRLWDDVRTALGRDHDEMARRGQGRARGRSDQPAAAGDNASLVTLSLDDAAEAASLLRADEADRAEICLAGIEGPGVDQSVLQPAQRARIHVTLPRASFEGDGPDLARRLRRLADAGLGGVVVHDLGQIRPALAAGLRLTGGEGVRTANDESILLLKELGFTAATLALDAPEADGHALLAARPALPLRACVYGWPAEAFGRASLPAAPEDGWVGPSGAPLRARVRDGLTELRSVTVRDRLADVPALVSAGLREVVVDLRDAPDATDGPSPTAVLGRLARPSRTRAGPTGLATEGDREVEQRLGRLYGAADRLTRSFREKHGLSCSSDCARCCAQLVPVWPIEAAALIPGVRGLVGSEQERVALRRRAEEQLEEQRAVFRAAGLHTHPSSMPIWRVRQGELEPLVGKRWSPCVLLRDGRCTVYERRPLLCRVYGFPTAAIPGNLCRRLSGPLLEAATNGRLPSIPAGHIQRMGEAIRRIQGLPEGHTDMTTVAAIVAHTLR